MKSKIVLSGFALMMLGYTAWRSYDYIGRSLTGVDQTTKFVISVAFLAFSEIGLLLWLHVGRPTATTDTQEATATALIWIDFIGILILGLGDMLRHNTFYVVDLSMLDPVLFLAPWILVAANLGGYLIYSMADSDEQLSRAERQLEHEEVRLEMSARRAGVRELRANQASIAEELAGHYYTNIRDKVSGRTAARYKRRAAVNGKTYDQEAETPAQPQPGPATNPTKARKS